MARDLSITTDFDDDGGPIEPRLALFAAAGFTCIHWCEHWSRDFLYEDFYTGGVLRSLAAAGIRLLDVHGAQTESATPSAVDEAVRARGVRLLRNRIRFTAALGGDAVVVHPGPFGPATPEGAARWSALERSIAEVAPLCEETGVRVALENASQPTPPEFLAMGERFPPAVVGYCFDSGHANLKGADPDLPAKLGERLVALHLHDNRGERDEHALPGRGTVDWDRLVRGLEAAGYRKPLNFELNLRSANLPAQEFLAEAFRLGSALADKVGGSPLPASRRGIQ